MLWLMIGLYTTCTRGICWLLLRAGLHEERLFMIICCVEWSEATVRRERRPR